jgi:hypothetical protein
MRAMQWPEEEPGYQPRPTTMRAMQWPEEEWGHYLKMPGRLSAESESSDSGLSCTM